MNAPIVAGVVRARSLGAACELAAGSGRQAELAAEVVAALNDESSFVRGAAIQAIERHPVLAEDFDPLAHADDEDHEVATIATLLSASTGRLVHDGVRLEALAQSPNVSSRTRLLAYAREHPEQDDGVLHILATDEFGYIRAAARVLLKRR